MHWFQSFARNRGIFCMKSQDFESATLNMLSQFSMEPRELPWQPNLNTNKPKLYWFQSCARNRGIFPMKSQDFGSVTLNMLLQFSWGPRELPWQPNSEKFKPKLHKFQFLARNLERGCWIQICYLNFLPSQGSLHGNQNYVRINQNSAEFSSVKAMETTFACIW